MSNNHPLYCASCQKEIEGKRTEVHTVDGRSRVLWANFHPACFEGSISSPELTMRRLREIANAE